MPKTRHLRRGIYLLPNLFTTAALFSGFYAVLAAMNGQFEKAALAIFIAMVLDGLDGRVARITNTQTAFGAEYDSLSDIANRQWFVILVQNQNISIKTIHGKHFNLTFLIIYNTLCLLSNFKGVFMVSYNFYNGDGATIKMF